MKNFIYYLMLPLMLLAFAACGEKNSDPGENPDKLVPDPEGTIEVSARYDAATGIETIRIDAAYNFSGAYFVSLGQMRGLGNITSIPKTGWAATVAVVPGNGYVAYSMGSFFRIYVEAELVGTTGGVIGYKLKYQAPFAGRDEELKLSQTSVTLDAENAATVNFLNTEIIPYTIETSEPWVRVEKASTGKHSFLSDAVYIRVDESGEKESTEATVTLKTLGGKTSTIQVNRTFGPYVSLIEPISGSLQLNPVGDKKRVAIVSNIGSTLQADANGVFDVKVEPSLKPSGQPSRLRFIGDRQAKEEELTRAESLFYYDIVITAPANTFGKRLTEKVNISASSPFFTVSGLFQIQQSSFFLDFSENSVHLKKEAGEKGISISTDLNSFDNLSVTSTEKWCRPALSYDEKSLVLTVDTNTGNSAREAEIKVLDFDKNEIASVKVSQFGTGVYLEQSKIYFERPQQSLTIEVNVPDALTASDIQCSENWLSATLTGTGRNALTIRVTEAAENRVGYVTFSGYPDRIEVRQSKYAVNDTYSENGVEGTVYKMEEGIGWLYKQLKETYPWSIEQVFLGATDKTDGRVNMEIVKSQPNWQTNYPAFAAVDALNAESVTGWYLPAVEEFFKGKPFGWSSTEASYILACGMGADDYFYKKDYFSVCAVHRFEY